MRHQVPAILAFSLVVVASFLAGQIVIKQSQAVQDQYTEMDLTELATQGQRARIK